MRDDYLWDKSGQPDPEIEQLEQLLGNLRYKRPANDLPLPERPPVSSRRSMFTPFLAAAAALFLMLAATGLWFVIGGNQKDAARALVSGVEPGRLPDWLNSESLSAITVREATNESAKPEHTIITASDSNSDRRRRASSFKRRTPSTVLVAKVQTIQGERISEDEGVAAREQLIKALHLASSKLNQVQKKVQDNKSPGPVS